MVLAVIGLAIGYVIGTGYAISQYDCESPESVKSAIRSVLIFTINWPIISFNVMSILFRRR